MTLKTAAREKSRTVHPPSLPLQFNDQHQNHQTNNASQPKNRKHNKRIAMAPVKRLRE